MIARWRAASSALAALLLPGLPAHAQDASTLRKEMVGQWELSTTERSKTCVVTLRDNATPQGFRLELEPGCAAALPFTKGITAWSIGVLGTLFGCRTPRGKR